MTLDEMDSFAYDHAVWHKRKRTATVKVSIDFPDAEGVWVSSVPVYERDSITDAIAEVSKMLTDSLARDAGELYRELHPR